MSKRTTTDVFAAIQVLDVTLIDNERTVAVRLLSADRTERAALLSLAVAGDLLAQLQDRLANSRALDAHSDGA